MKTPWMKTTYGKLETDQYRIENVDNGLVKIISSSEESEYYLTCEEYEQYCQNTLDYLKMENMYYRGLAVDD